MRIGFGFALVLTALGLGASKASALTLDRTQTLEQILADCDPQTGLPHGVTPPATAAGDQRRRVIINPDWLRRPSAGDVAKVYPAEARAGRVSGHTVVDCLVGTNGTPHDCQVSEETPAAMGFGDAALKMAAQTLFIPRRVDCAPVDGGRVKMPFSFSP
jgi:protein TonB